MSEPTTEAGRMLLARGDGWNLWTAHMEREAVIADIRAIETEAAKAEAARWRMASPRVRELLEDMVAQFGYWSDTIGGVGTGGLSTLEEAFAVLGWDDPHPMPRLRCDEPGCLRQIHAGTPTPTGYRQTCHEHRP